MVSVRAVRFGVALVVAVLSAIGVSPRADSQPVPSSGPSEPAVAPQRVFAAIVERFHSHRLPPFVAYTLTRA